MTCPDGCDQVIDSYEGSNDDLPECWMVGDYIGQAFTMGGTARDICCAKFTVDTYDWDGVTIDVAAKIYACTGTPGTDGVPTGSALATSNSVQFTEEVISETTFTFGTPFTLNASTNYCIVLEITAVDGDWEVGPTSDGTAPTHDGNYCYVVAGGEPGAKSGWDVNFFMYYNPILPDTNLLDGKLKIINKVTINADGKVSIKDDISGIVDGKVQLKDSITDLLDGKVRIKDSITGLVDGLVQIKDPITGLVDGKVQLKDSIASLVDGKVQLKDKVTGLLDGKVQLKDKVTDLVDGLMKVRDDRTDLIDGKLRIGDVVTGLVDGIVNIKDKTVSLLDGKLVTAWQSKNIFDGLLQIPNRYNISILDSEAQHTITTSSESQYIISTSSEPQHNIVMIRDEE